MSVRAGEDEGAQVLVHPAKPAAIEDPLHGKRYDRLRDEASRPGLDAQLELRALLLARLGADQHPVSAGGVDRLDHQVVQALEHVPAVLVQWAEVSVPNA